MSLIWKCISRPIFRHARSQPYHNNWVPATQKLQNHYASLPNSSRWLSSSAITVGAWTKEEEDLLLQLRELGVPYREIADRLGRSYIAVSSRLRELRRRGQRPKRHHATVAKKYWNEEEMSILKSLRAEGKPWKEIAPVLGRSIQSVRSAFHQDKKAPKDLSRADLPWQAEDDATLMAMRTNGSSWAVIAAALRRSNGGVVGRWHLLDTYVPRPASSWFFTKEEDELLLRLKVDEKKSWDQIVRAFGGSKELSSLRDRFQNLQTTTLSDELPPTRKPWTQDDIAKLRQLFDSSTTRSSMALQLGRSKFAVGQAIKAHVLKEVRRPVVPWSTEEDSTLLRHRRELCMPYSEIAAVLGRTVDACQSRYNTVLRYRSPISAETTTGKNELEALGDKTTPVEQLGS